MRYRSTGRMTCDIQPGPGHYRFVSSYNPDALAAMKARIPAAGRRWNGQDKVWEVAPEYGKELVDVAADYYSTLVSLPPLPTAKAGPTVKLLEVRYLGHARDRGDGHRIAYGNVNGEWAALFPEEVLRQWFGQRAQPGEASTLYEVLGVDEKAAAADIKKGYKRMARQWHPDVCKEPNAQAQFIAIQQAYETLSDPGARARYNAGLHFERLLKDKQKRVADHYDASREYVPPMRCGQLLVMAVESLGRYNVTEILAWEDITNSNGDILVTSWPDGADTFTEDWVKP